MKEVIREYPFRCVLSLEPLIEFWNGMPGLGGGNGSGMPEDIRRDLALAPELLGPIEDLGVLKRHEGLVRRLMAAVFPSALWETEALAAMVPMAMKPALLSPLFETLFIREDGSFKGRTSLDPADYLRARVMRAYFLILGECYGIREGSFHPLIHVVPHHETGLDRYFSFKARQRFVRVRNVSGPQSLSDQEKNRIMENLNEPDVIRQILPPECFEFSGFAMLEAVDVTETEVIAALDRDLVSKNSLVSQDGFLAIQQRLRTLFNRPDLTAGLAAIKGDQALLLSSGCEIRCNCIFGDSQHVSTDQFIGSVFHRAVMKGGITRIRDLMDEPHLTPPDREMLENGLRAIIIVPLYFRDQPIGTLKLCSPEPGAFGPTDELIANQIIPMFTMALQRSLEKLDNDVDAIIKQKCTAVHPSVEWRFKKAVFEHLETIHRGDTQEMAPIVFNDVHPLYGATDIRGSSEARNESIRVDLDEHLSLAANVVETAWQTRPLPILKELSHQIQDNLERIRDGVSTGEELAVTRFIRYEVEPVFAPLQSFGPRVTDAIAAYERCLDPVKRMIYCKRKDYEQSVSLFNDRLAGYLDREEAEAQAIFPHYFDKRQTDGLDYVIYLGSSMVENNSFDDLYVRNLRIWQIMVACGLAWHAEQLKATLKVPLSATHLILVNHNPLAIRFRFEEKRFDVDGAYNIGHEIIRSRIDKAMVKGRSERLTQPEKIAIVYSRPEEAREMLKHIEYLKAEGFLLPEVEHLDLDDLPGVKGLRALRVGVNLESKALESRVRYMAGLPQTPVRHAAL